MGHTASRAMMSPLRNVLACSALPGFGSRASCIRTRPASTSSSLPTMRENFARGRALARSCACDIFEPAEIPLRRERLRHQSHLLDTARDRYRVPAEFRSLDKDFDRLGRDMGCGGRMPVERAAVRNDPKEVAVVSFEIGFAGRAQMRGAASDAQPSRRPQSILPARRSASGHSSSGRARNISEAPARTGRAVSRARCRRRSPSPGWFRGRNKPEPWSACCGDRARGGPVHSCRAAC